MLPQMTEVSSNLASKETKTAKKTSSIIGTYTGLRGLAIFFVLAFHYFPANLPGGWLAVLIFFYLSGYFITDGLIKQFRQEQRLHFPNYLKKRAVKIYPALLFYLLLLSSILFLFFPDLLLNYRHAFFSSLFGYNNWWQIAQNLSYFDQHGSVNLYRHLWMLAQEIQLYLIWFLVVYFVLRVTQPKWKKMQLGRSRLVLATVALILSLFSALLLAIGYWSSWGITRLYYGTDTRAFAFLLGALVASLIPKQRLMSFTFLQQRLQNQLFYWGLALLLLAQLLWVNGSSAYAYSGGMLLFALQLCCFIPLLANDQTWLGKALASAPMRWLGERSYALYLWQVSLMEIATFVFKFTRVPSIYQILIQIPVLLLLSELTYQVAERHWLAGWRRFKQEAKGFWYERHYRPAFLVQVMTLVLLLGFSSSAILTARTGQANYRDELEQKLKEAEEFQNQRKQQLATEPKPTETQTSEGKGAEGSTPSPSPSIEGQQNPWANLPQTVKNFEKTSEKYPELKMTDLELKVASNVKLTAIGDSVLATDLPSVTEQLPLIEPDATPSRQGPDAMELLRKLEAQGALRDRLLFAIGTNGVLDSGDLEEWISSHPKQTVYLMTVVLHTPSVEENINSFYKSLAKKYSNVYLIDWYAFAKAKAELFYDDATHPNTEGGFAYAQFLAKSISSIEAKRTP